MTHGEAIKEWLKKCDRVEVVEIETDRLEAQAESMGLYKQPGRETEVYLDGSKRATEYYYFLLRRPAQLESERTQSQALMEDIEDWVEEMDWNEIYPEIDGMESIFVTNGFYLLDSESDESVYQVSIGITYLKERE